MTTAGNTAAIVKTAAAATALVRDTKPRDLLIAKSLLVVIT